MRDCNIFHNFHSAQSKAKSYCESDTTNYAFSDKVQLFSLQQGTVGKLWAVWCNPIDSTSMVQSYLMLLLKSQQRIWKLLTWDLSQSFLVDYWGPFWKRQTLNVGFPHTSFRYSHHGELFMKIRCQKSYS